MNSNERGRKPPDREIDAPVNGIAITAAADRAHVHHDVAFEAVRTGDVLAMRDRSGRLFVSPSAVGILERMGAEVAR